MCLTLHYLPSSSWIHMCGINNTSSLTACLKVMNLIKMKETLCLYHLIGRRSQIGQGHLSSPQGLLVPSLLAVAVTHPRAHPMSHLVIAVSLLTHQASHLAEIDWTSSLFQCCCCLFDILLLIMLFCLKIKICLRYRVFTSENVDRSKSSINLD